MRPAIKQLKSAVLYRGISQIDGAPIVMIGIAKSNNDKTGNMVQTLIMHANMSPLDAIKVGADKSVCGDCLARPANEGWCYVNVAQSVSVVWNCWKQNTYKRGGGKTGIYAGYPDISDDPCAIAEFCRGRDIRFGTYGDPAAIPFQTLETMASQASGWDGYTHQWRDARVIPYARFLMASVDRPCETLSAELMGFRAFVAMLPGEVAATDTKRKPVACPAGPKESEVTCVQCMGCGGNDGPGSTHRTIEVHGAGGKVGNYVAWRAQRDAA